MTTKTSALTFRDLTRLSNHGFELTSDAHAPINLPLVFNGNTCAEFDTYRFERVAPDIPGSDRLWTLEFDPEALTPWTAWWDDRDDNGKTYASDYQDGLASIDEAMGYLHGVPWQPPASRIVELLREVEGTITCAQDVLTLPDGRQIPLPGCDLILPKETA